ncbi:MAG: chemotaxis response regulator protein-glutamate methylesterase [Candidatus Firestonebacteria bacterium]|nr:chemotaxis response regulator protein-glutamate methylesterase [Candidatus Firestonebacteria bacterium]
MTKKVRLLIVDDSPTMRQLLARCLQNAGEVEVVGEAGDPFEAREKIFDLNPDVLTMDIEMPRMDGLTFLRKITAHHPMPVVIISSLTTAQSDIALQALQFGAMEVMCKPDSLEQIPAFQRSLLAKIKAIAAARFNQTDKTSGGNLTFLYPPPADHVLAIGASTGGIDAILRVVSVLPSNTPPTVITQHLPKTFTPAFARMLKAQSALDVREAQGGEVLLPGHAYLAPGGRHLLIKKQGRQYVAQVKIGPDVCFQCPSVDVMFGSVARETQGKSVGVLLTGMGNDGAQGLLAMRQAGGVTLAQDEASCVVYGMPQAAAAINAADKILPLGLIPQGILAGFQQRKSASGGAL